MHQKTITAVLSIAISIGAAAGESATVSFDSLSSGTQFGGSFGNSPGDQLLIEEGVLVTLENYTQDSFTGFNSATAHTDPVAMAISADAIRLNNISLLFDFTTVGFIVTEVTFDYADFGGGENLGINGTILELNRLSSAPMISNGINISVIEGPVNGGNLAGTVTLTGNIQSLLLGGQEFAIDNVTATPTPSAAVTLGISALFAARRRR